MLLFLVPLNVLLIEFVICTHTSYTEHLLWVKDVSMQNKKEESHFLLQGISITETLWRDSGVLSHCPNTQTSLLLPNLPIGHEGYIKYLGLQ